MALGRRKPTWRDKATSWLSAHNTWACAGIACGAAAALVGLFLFVVFTGFGASADFIYNQF